MVAVVRGLAGSGMSALPHKFAGAALHRERCSQASTIVEVRHRVLASSIVSHVHTGWGHGHRSLDPQFLGCQKLADLLPSTLRWSGIDSETAAPGPGSCSMLQLGAKIACKLCCYTDSVQFRRWEAEKNSAQRKSAPVQATCGKH